jgi:LAO/AO transport system kinase
LTHVAESALRVSAGCATPEPPHNTAARAANNLRALSRDEYISGILQRDRRILSRAITLIESSRPADREFAEEIIEACLPHSGRAFRIGITGVPGVGKSTLIEALGQNLIGEYGQSVAVLTIDPSSQLTGGSILGDKTRMVSLSSSEMAFIRPSPSRGSFGGVAQHTREAMLLCDAAGYDNILVETIGVGQSETAVHQMVDFFLLIMLAGAGDELQGMKRGVMELADLIAINKADGENIAAAERARADTETALHFFSPPASGWTPRAIACSARTGRGIADLWNAVREFAVVANSNGSFESNRREQRRRWLRDSLEHGLAQIFRSHPFIRRQVAAYEREVLDGRTTPFHAARALLEIYAGSPRTSL